MLVTLGELPLVTAAALYILQHWDYDSYSRREADGAEKQLQFEDWCHQRQRIPQF